MGNKALDLAGRSFGNLEVLSCVGKNERGARLWEVLCHRCGQKKVMVSSCIKESKDCGCKFKDKRSDLSGRSFGFLDVIERVGTDKAGNALYLCKRNLCGAEKEIPACSLRAGQKSCGCYINHDALRAAAVKGGARMSDDPSVRQKWKDTMKKTGKDIELAARINKERVEKIHVQGTNLPAVRRKEPDLNNRSGYRGVYIVTRRGKRKFKGRVQIQGEVRYTREFCTAEEAKEARDALQKEMIEAHGLSELIFGSEQE